jgi:TonB-dependent receptor
MKKVILMILFVIVFSTQISAQGSLKGIVSDSTINKPLIGANVFIMGTSLGSATDIEGFYKISKIPEGTYTLKISYIGYLSKEFSIKIQNNRTLELNATLIPDVLEGETVIVTAQAQGQAAAINQQITSNTIVNVISEEKIKELPDANAAEAIGRLPGVSILRSGGEANKIILRGLSDRYTNFTIDGIKMASTDVSARGLDLSTISQSSLAGIELYKALTSDKDADAIAGSVNLVTKKAPSLREFNVTAKGNYNDLMQSVKQYDFSFKYGERFFDNFLGVQLTGNLEDKIRSNESVDLDYDQTINNQTDYEINNFTLQFNDEIRSRKGFSLLLDINTPDQGSLKLNTVFNGTNRDYLNHSRDYPSGGGTGGTVTYSFRDREHEINTFTSSLTGDNNILDVQINWGLSFAQSKSEALYDYQLNFLEPSVLGSAGMGNAPRLKDNPEKIIPFAYNNFQTATFYSANYRNQKNFEKEKTAFLNLAKEYLIDNNFTGVVKLGAKYKSKSRSNVSSLYYAPYYLGFWQPYEKTDDGRIIAKDFSGSYFEAFYKRYQQNPINRSLAFSEFLDAQPQSRELYDKYKLFPLINREKLRQWYEINKNGVDQNGSNREYSFDPSEKANFYDITESVYSAYLMNTLNIGRNIVFIAGLRIESEDNSYNSMYSPIQTGGFPIPQDASKDTTASYKQTIVLPNFHLNFRATEFLNIRLAVYKALARPDFNYRLNTYFAWRPATTSSDKQLTLGNPLLKTAQAWNYEINTSFYGNEIGLISLSAFYKDIKDMYHFLSGLNTSGNVMLQHLGLNWKTLHSGVYALNIPYNSPKPTKVYGIEFEHQINFTFLPGLLKNIVLSYNASLVKSETWLIGARTDTTYVQVLPPPFPKTPKYTEVPIQTKQQLENQPRFYGNIALGYDLGGFSGRISVFHQSEYNRSFTPSGRGDQITKSYTRVDLALKQELFGYLSVILNVNNLTNIREDRLIYNRVNGYKILNISELYGMTADLGVKISL